MADTHTHTHILQAVERKQINTNLQEYDNYESEFEGNKKDFSTEKDLGIMQIPL